jgi:hypothetical protein
VLVLLGTTLACIGNHGIIAEAGVICEQIFLVFLFGDSLLSPLCRL